ncbi:MAG: transporter substrate-binding domain-containing protein, partial [SAR324 cluster bacterium]|nr:transporter substrate-binding domain-containing protein [SAR324 cluster bacterium]
MKLLFYFFFILSLFWANSIFADQKGVLLRVGAPEYYPLSFAGKDKTAQGFFVEYLKDLGKKEKWELTFEFGTREELLTRLEKGEIDLVLSVDYKAEFKERFTLTHERIVADWGQVILRDGLSLDSILDLEGKVIAVNKDGPFYTEIYKFSDSLNHKPVIRYAESYEEIFELVRSKQVDAGLITRVFAQSQIKPLTLHRNAVSLSPTGVGFAFTKDKFEEIRKEIDEHLHEDKLDRKSIYHQLYKKWFPKRSAPLNPQM